MRILLTSPFAHPYVRRGVERYVAELAGWLAGRGHDVTLLTTAPDRSRLEQLEGGATVRYVRSGRPFGRGRVSVGALLRTTPALVRALRREGPFDAVEAHHWPDAAALRLTGRKRQPPFVLWLPGVARRSYPAGKPIDRVVAHYGLRGAATILALSRYAADILHAELGMRATVMAPGVDTASYAGPRDDGQAPTILCTAAAGDVRKRVAVLVGAFAELSGQRPDVRLLLAPPDPPAARALVTGLPRELASRISVVEVTERSELACHYRWATVSVLPSVDEAFGLVLVESLAAGTPVVGTDSGAIPEIIRDPTVGRLAAPDDSAALARALLETLELGSSPGTAAACRAAARQWDWSVVGPRIEALHQAGPG